jgi:large subunit ribosomal protein L19
MSMDKLIMVQKQFMESSKKDYPEFKAGDIITVHYRIREAEKEERIQHLEGIVIKIQGSLNQKAFTIRRIVFGEAYEITFPYYSPNIAKIVMTKEAHKRARRARLFYMRDRIGKDAMLS